MIWSIVLISLSLSIFFIYTFMLLAAAVRPHLHRVALASSCTSRNAVSMATASASAATDVVLIEPTPSRVRKLTLNRPRQLNALNEDVCATLRRAIDAWERDDAVCGVLLTGAGEKAFCAGGDVRALYDAGREGNLQPARSFFGTEYKLNYALGTYAKPIVSVVDGITMGGGGGVSMHGRYVVATERTLFAMPETALGLFPDVGAARFLTRRPGIAMGAWLALTGARIKAPELIALGLATHVVRSDALPALEARLRGVAADWNDDGVGADAAIRAALEEFSGDADLAKLSDDSALHCASAIEACFSKSSVEDVIGELERVAASTNIPREATWARTSLQQIASAAPISLKVTLRHMRDSVGLSLHDVLTMDYRLACHFTRGSTFYEGVRAILVDKDRSPRFEPSSLADVSDEDVDAYFQRPEDGDIDLDETRQPGFFEGRL